MMNEPGLGTKIDEKYILQELIGTGASGSVYKARHIFLEQSLAIKFFASELIDNVSAVERFKREATLLSTLSHPNIVKFHSFGSFSGRQYMALELIDGESLAALLSREDALPEERALPIFLDICHGLEYVHSKGVVHRDLKPGNVMIAEHEGERSVKLIDFGVLKSSGNDQSLTKTGLLVGSSNYMSPEQCRGAAVDERSDIYSMGCLMYETLVGKAPMDAETDLLILNNQMSKQLNSVPARQGISQEMETLILRCLNKDPDSRFARAADLSAALDAAKDKPKIRRKNKNKYLLYGKIAAAVLLIGGTVAGIRLFQRQDMNRTDQDIKIRVETEYNMDKAPDLTKNLPRSLQQLSEWLNNDRHKSVNRAILAKTQYQLGQARLRLGLPQIREDFLDANQVKQYSTNLAAIQEYSELIDFRQFMPPDKLLLSEDFDAGVVEAEAGIRDLSSLLELVEPKDGFISRIKFVQAQSRLRLAEIESWTGHFARAEEHAKQAFNMASGTQSIRIDSKLRLALVQYMHGQWDKSAKTVKQELALAKDVHQTSNDLALGDDSLELANDVGLYADVTRFMEFCFPHPFENSPENHVRKIARMQLELARAYLLENKLDKCFATLDQLLAYFKTRYNSSDARDRTEGLYLKALHLAKRDAEISVHLRRYLEQLKDVNLTLSKTRVLEAAPELICTLVRIGHNTSIVDEQIAAELSEAEKSESIPAICAEIRLAQGFAALNLKDYPSALKFYEQAEKDCQNKTTQQSRYLLALALAKQMQCCLALKRYDEVIKRHQTLLTYDVKVKPTDEKTRKLLAMAAPLSFFGRHLNLVAKYQGKLTGEKDPIEGLTKMLHTHKRSSISTIYDYPDCAMSLAEIYVQNEKPDFAIKTLELAIFYMEANQCWRVRQTQKLLELKCKLLEEKLKQDKYKSDNELRAELLRDRDCLEDLKLYTSDPRKSLINDGALEPPPWLSPT